MQQKQSSDISPEGGPARGIGTHAAMFVFLTVCLDSIGIGIIIPVLPDLIRELAGLGLDGAAIWGGWLSFSYAIMQFIFGPLIGNLSDRFGRRPVLLASLGILAIDYLIMALAPSLLVLFIGRIMAGIAAATYSTCNAFVADVSKPQDRAKNFGLLGAGFGLGFIIGPVIGGVVAELGTRAPFYAAAGFALINFCYGLFVLPESLVAEKRRKFEWQRANPLGAFKHMRKVPTVAWFLVAIFLFDIAHFVYPAVWAYYTKEMFAWSSAEVGFSLAVVGVAMVVVQGWLIRLILPWLGDVRTTIVGLVINAVTLTMVAFTSEGWWIYILLPIVSLGAVVTPALTGLMSNRIADDSQGELQGAMTSITAVTLVISPVVMTQLFGYFASPAAPVYFPGAPFLAAAIMSLAALVPLAIGLKFETTD